MARSARGGVRRPARRPGQGGGRRGRAAAVQVRFERNPLRREAILSGHADRFQREGMGQFPGLNDRVRAVPGVSGVRWEGDEMPLIAETLILVALAY